LDNAFPICTTYLGERVGTVYPVRTAGHDVLLEEDEEEEEEEEEGLGHSLCLRLRLPSLATIV
jgi:hypothetical protein